MKQTHLLTLLSLLLLLNACTSKTNKETLHGDWKTLESADYTIAYPAIWTLNQGNTNGQAFMLFSPKASKDDAFIENVNLSIQDLRGQNIPTLEAFTKLSENQIATMLTHPEILSSETIQRNGHSCQRVRFLADQGVFKLRYEQYYLVEETMAYVLTFTAEQDEFDQYEETAGKILDSFKLKH